MVFSLIPETGAALFFISFSRCCLMVLDLYSYGSAWVAQKWLKKKKKNRNG
jgi:hypothetical protein